MDVLCVVSTYFNGTNAHIRCLLITCIPQGCQSSVASAVTRLLDGRSGFRIPVRKSGVSLLQYFHTGYGAHPASCSVGTGVHFRDKTAGGWIKTAFQLLLKVSRCLTLHLNYTSSRCGRENLTFLFNKYKYFVSLLNQTKSCCLCTVGTTLLARYGDGIITLTFRRLTPSNARSVVIHATWASAHFTCDVNQF